MLQRGKLGRPFHQKQLSYLTLKEGENMNSLMEKLAIGTILFVIALPIGEASAAEELIPYVDGSKSFLEIKDISSQAEAWAVCAATYDVMAQILSEFQPARAQQLRDLAKGAKITVIMAVASDGLEPDIPQERFNELWAMAKLAGTELSSTKRTMLAADAESSTGKGAEMFVGNLSATMEICFKNLRGQRMYIDSWNELVKSGKLKKSTK